MLSPSYSNARQLFQQSVAVRGGGFMWWTYAVADPIEIVVTHYERVLGRMATMQHSASNPSVRSFDFDLPGAMLAIYPARDHLAFPNGGAAFGPRPDEQTVLLYATRP